MKRRKQHRVNHPQLREPIRRMEIGQRVQAPRVIQPHQAASPINFPINLYDPEVFDELPTIRIPKIVQGLQPVVDLGYF